MNEDLAKFEQRFAVQINPTDRCRLFEHIVLKKDLILLLTNTRLELHKVRDREACYSRRLLWYQPLEHISKQSVQGYDVQHQGAVSTRVMIVINNVLFLYLINFSPWGFRNCVCLVKHQLIPDTHEGISVYDAKFFNDFDVAFTKKLESERVAPHLAEENQKVFLRKIRNLPLDCHRRQAQDTSDEIRTKNFSDEPMKISFCARYLHLLLGTSKTIQVLCVPIYMTPDLSEKDADELYEMNALEKDREARTKPWHERYGDSVLKDLDFSLSRQATKPWQNRAGSKQEDPELERKMLRYQKLISSRRNVIAEMVSTNLYSSDRLVFYVEKGFNPNFVIEGCYCSGLRTILSYSFEDIFKVSLDLENEETLTFSNLQVQLESIYDSFNESSPSKMLEIIELRTHDMPKSADNPGRGALGHETSSSRNYILLMRIVYYQYRVTFYCEEKDSLVIIWLRIKESQHYSPKEEHLERETDLQDFKRDKARFRMLGHLRYKHEITTNNREVIKQFAENELKVVQGPRIDVEPKDRIRKCMFNSHDHEQPYVKQFAPVEDRNHSEADFYRKNFTRYTIDPEALRLDPVVDQLYWIDQNWCVKFVGIEKNAKSQTHRFSFKSRDKDLNSLEALEEFSVKLKRKLEQSAGAGANSNRGPPNQSFRQGKSAYENEPNGGSNRPKNQNPYEAQNKKYKPKKTNWSDWDDTEDPKANKRDIAVPEGIGAKVGKFKDDSRSPSPSSNKSSPRQAIDRSFQKEKQNPRLSSNGTFEDSELFPGPVRSTGSRKPQPDFDSVSRISRKHEQEGDSLSSVNTSFRQPGNQSHRSKDQSFGRPQDNLTFHDLGFDQDGRKEDSFQGSQKNNKNDESRFSFQRDKSASGDTSLETNQFQDILDSGNNSINPDFLQDDDWNDFRNPQVRVERSGRNPQEPDWSDGQFRGGRGRGGWEGEQPGYRDNHQKPRNGGFKKKNKNW